MPSKEAAVPTSTPTIDRALPRRARAGGARWRTAESIDPAVLEAALAALAAIERGGAPAPGVEILKHRPARKLVFAFDGPGATPLVAKVAWLDTWKRVLERRRFGPIEAANLFEARARGVTVPIAHAVGLVPGRLGVPRRAVLILSRLVGYRPVKALPAEPGAVLDATLPVFESLHRTATHHLDVNADNVLLGPRPDDPPALIDLTHVVFGSRPSVEMLLFQAGWFARSCVMIEAAVLEAWLDRLIDRFELRAECRARLDESRSRDRSRAERRALARAAAGGG